MADKTEKIDMADLIQSVNAMYEKWNAAMQQHDIDSCPHNANPQAGICPAARDTFLIMWRQMLDGLVKGKD